MAQVTRQTVFGVPGRVLSFSAKAAAAITHPRTVVIGPIPLSLSADDVVAIGVVKVSGTANPVTIANASELTMEER